MCYYEYSAMREIGYPHEQIRDFLQNSRGESEENVEDFKERYNGKDSNNNT